SREARHDRLHTDRSSRVPLRMRNTGRPQSADTAEQPTTGEKLMHWTNTKRLLAGLAIATAISTTAFALPAEAAGLRMAWSQDATGLDPHKQTAFSSLRLLELIYEPLVRLDNKLNVVRAIATSWEFAADGKTLSFKLDPKAKFTNGAQVTSAAVKASFTRILDEATAAAARSNFLSIDTIDTPDPQTVI